MVAIGTAITTALVSYGVSTTIATLASQLIVSTLSSLAVSAVSSLLRGSPSGNSTPASDARGRLATVRQSVPPRAVLYGEVRVGGAVTHMFLQERVHLHQVHTLAGHECAGIDEIYYSDIPLKLASGNTGVVESGRYSQTGATRAQYSLGDEAAGVQPFQQMEDAPGSTWTATHNQTGCAKLWTRMANRPNVFPNGLPPVSALVRGKKVYDPRTGLTVWSRNWALIVNDFLTTPRARGGLGVDYATGVGEDELIAAANTSDERVLLSGNETALVTFSATLDTFTVPEGGRVPRIGDGVRFGASGSPAGHVPAPLVAGTTYYVTWGRHGGRRLATSVANALVGTYIDITGTTADPVTMTHYDEARYCADGRYLYNATPKQILANLQAAGAGRIVNVGGKWFIYAGAYEAPSITLTQNDLAGPLTTRPIVSRRDNCNGIKGVFVDPSQHWQVADAPPVAPQAYADQDGGRVWRDLDLSGFVTSPTQWQRVAKINLLQTRQSMVIEGNYKLGAYRVATGRTFAKTFPLWGLTEKAFQCESLKFTPGSDGTLTVNIQARETAAAIYDWSTSEEGSVDIAPNTDFGDPSEGLEITGLTASSGTDDLLLQGDGTVVPRVRLRWTAPSNEWLQYFQLQVSAAGSPTTWIDCPDVDGGATEGFAHPVNDGDVVDLRIRAFTTLGGQGEWYYVYGHTVIGKTAVPSDVENFTAVQQGVAVVLSCDEVPDPDLDAVEVRLNRFEDAAWDNGTPIANILRGQSLTTATIQPGTWTLLAKARDTSGNYSANAARADIQVTNEGYLTIDTHQAAPEWEGLQFENYLVRSSALDHADWSLFSLLAFGSGSVANTTDKPAPDGTFSAEYLVENTTPSATHFAGNFIEYDSFFDPKVFSFYAAPGGRTQCFIQGIGPTSQDRGGAIFDLSAGTATIFSGSSTPPDAGIGMADRYGWRRCWIRFVSGVQVAQVRLGLCNAAGSRTYTGDGVSGLYLWGVQQNSGAIPLPYTYTGAVAKTTRDNFIKSVSGKLIPMSTRVMSSVTEAEFDAGLNPDPEETCTYTAPEVDKGVDAVARIYADIDSEPAPDETMSLLPQHRVDWKLTADSYDGFENWTIGSVRFGQVKSGFTLSTAQGVPVIAGFETVIDAFYRSEDGVETVGAGGSVAVVFETEWNQAPFLQVTPQGSGDVTASYDSLTADGFTGYHKTAGVASAGTISWRAQGA